MFLSVFLLGVLRAEAAEECFKDLNSFQCSCIDQKGFTPFWTDHHRLEQNNWVANFSLSDKNCNEHDALEFIRHENLTVVIPPNPPDSKLPIDDKQIERLVSIGYVRNGNSLYKLHSKATYWDNARRICLNEGSHLAIPNSEDELKLLTNLAKSKNEQVFVGIHDIFNEGEHLTIFGEPASVAFPSFENVVVLSNTMDPPMGISGEDCITISLDGIPNDVACGHTYNFLCEVEINGYPPEREINYNAGPYNGIESSWQTKKGRVERTVPSVGYEYFPGFGFYRFHTTPQVWDYARQICEMEGGHLAIVNSIYEHNILKQFFKKVRPRTPPESDDEDRAHIGFHDLFQEGNYVTIYHESLNSTGFLEWFEPNQPNNEKTHEKSSGQNCGVLHRNGGFDDFDCNSFLSYFCEQDLFEDE